MRKIRLSWSALRFLGSSLSVIFILLYVMAKSHDVYSINKLPVDGELVQKHGPSASQAKTKAAETRHLYNLMEEKYGKRWRKQRAQYFSIDKCTIDYVNANQLQQDHPCVIHLIKKNYLIQPTPRSLPYKIFEWPKQTDPSDGQAQAVLRMLGNRTNGFFIEAGAHDGEFLSNTLYMERFLNWTGLLVEGNEMALKQLAVRNRKAYILPGCLSTKPYPMKVMFDHTSMLTSFVIEETENQEVNPANHQQQEPIDGKPNKNHSNNSAVISEIQCFPLYSILLAIGRTQIDFFSLDVEGAEYKILSTIPWHKVDLTILCAEWNHIPEGEPAMTRLMEENKFIKFGFVELPFSNDVIYMKDFLHDYRLLFDD